MFSLGNDFGLLETGVIDFDFELFFLLAFGIAHPLALNKLFKLY